jgi:hypothetical protein
MNLVISKKENGMYEIFFNTEAANMRNYNSEQNKNDAIVLAVLDILLICLSFWDIYN